MTAPSHSGESLKALAQLRLKQMCGHTFARAFERSFTPECRHLCPEDREQTCGSDARLLRACEALCRKTGGDVSALASQIEAAYRRLRHELAGASERRFASETLDVDSDPVLVAICVRGAGCALLRIPRSRYDERQVLEIIHRASKPV